MVVIALYFIDHVVEVFIVWRNDGDSYRIVASSSSFLLLYFLSGAHSVLPMGVAPEAIAEKFFSGIGSKDMNSS
jgi:hypothetical protein